ncbi:MAG: hypothetical protein Kow0090_14060 [Myxococcota bacterium]
METPSNIRTLLITYLTPSAFKADFPKTLAEGGIFIPDYFGAKENETLFLDLRTPTGLCLGELPARVKEVLQLGNYKGTTFIYMLSREERRSAWENFGGKSGEIPDSGFALIPHIRYRTKDEFNAVLVEKVELSPAEETPQKQSKPVKTGWEGLLDGVSPSPIQSEPNPTPLVAEEEPAYDKNERQEKRLDEDILNSFAPPSVSNTELRLTTDDFVVTPTAEPTSDEKAKSEIAAPTAPTPFPVSDTPLAPPKVTYPYPHSPTLRAANEEFDVDKIVSPFAKSSETTGASGFDPYPLSEKKILGFVYLGLSLIILFGSLYIFLGGDDEEDEDKATQVLSRDGAAQHPSRPTEPRKESASPFASPARDKTSEHSDWKLTPGTPEEEKARLEPTARELAKKYDEMGEDLYRKGQKPLAEAFFEKAIRLDPNSMNARYRLSPARIREILESSNQPEWK